MQKQRRHRQGLMLHGNRKFAVLFLGGIHLMHGQTAKHIREGKNNTSNQVQIR